MGESSICGDCLEQEAPNHGLFFFSRAVILYHYFILVQWFSVSLHEICKNPSEDPGHDAPTGQSLELALYALRML